MRRALPLGAQLYLLLLLVVVPFLGTLGYQYWSDVSAARESAGEQLRLIARAVAADVKLPPGYYLEWGGQFENQQRAAKRLAVVVPIAIGLIFLLLFSTFGGLSGIVLAGPRVYFSMAQDGLLFRWLGAVHPRFHTPARAIVLQAVWSSVLVASDTYQTLFTRVVYTEWIFFALLAVGLFLLRRRPGYAPRYRIAGFPVVPALFALASLGIVLNEVAADPRNRLGGLLFVLLGWPVYHWWVRLKPTDRGTA